MKECSHTLAAKSYLPSSFPLPKSTLYRSIINYQSIPQYIWRKNIEQHFLNNWNLLWEIPSRELQPCCVFMMEISHENEVLAFSHESPEIELWNINSRRRLVSIPAHNDIITTFAFFNNDSTYFFTASLDQTICILKNRLKYQEMTHHPN